MTKHQVGDVRDYGALRQYIDDAQPEILFHLRQGDYSRWLRKQIKDDALADRAAEIEQRTDLSPQESRALLRSVIEQSYTLPEAGPPLPIPDAGKRSDAHFA